MRLKHNEQDIYIHISETCSKLLISFYLRTKAAWIDDQSKKLKNLS